MRLMTLLFLVFIYSIAVAAPLKSSSLPTVPPPPPLESKATEASDTGDAELEPPVTIIKKTEQTVEEYRAGGKLYMIKIIPKVGPPYYLVDDRGDGTFTRRENLDSGVRPPRWVIHSF